MFGLIKKQFQIEPIIIRSQSDQRLIQKPGHQDKILSYAPVLAVKPRFRQNIQENKTVSINNPIITIIQHSEIPDIPDDQN